MRQNFPYVWAVYAFFIQWNQILLLRRANTTYMDGMWSVPAGHMDGWEFARDAIIREISEEVWIVLNPSQLLRPIQLFRITANNNGSERFEVFFPVAQRDGELTNNEPHKCDALEWFEMNNLPDNIIPYIKTMIEEYTQWKTFVEINEQTGEMYSM
jgi:8-oxo-dGTP diphosphatase